MMKILKKNLKTQILSLVFVFSTVYWILLKFCDCKLTQISRGESKILWQIRTRKKSKNFASQFARKIAPCPLYRKNIRVIDYKPLPVIPAYTSVWKNSRFFWKKIFNLAVKLSRAEKNEFFHFFKKKFHFRRNSFGKKKKLGFFKGYLVRRAKASFCSLFAKEMLSGKNHLSDEMMKQHASKMKFHFYKTKNWAGKYFVFVVRE